MKRFRNHWSSWLLIGYLAVVGCGSSGADGIDSGASPLLDFDTYDGDTTLEAFIGRAGVCMDEFYHPQPHHDAWHNPQCNLVCRSILEPAETFEPGPIYEELLSPEQWVIYAQLSQQSFVLMCADALSERSLNNVRTVDDCLNLFEDFCERYQSGSTPKQSPQ